MQNNENITSENDASATPENVTYYYYYNEKETTPKPSYIDLYSKYHPLKNYTTDWGPKRDPLYIVIPITITYCIIFLTGLIGNISTCIVIAKNKSMHTATNYYLFSLAISDLLLLVTALPNEMYLTWSKYPYHLGEKFCILHGFAAETSANATVLTITAFTVERYVAICYPFLSHTLSKLSRAIKFIVAVWILAMCLAIPQALSFGIFYELDSNGQMVNEDHYICTVKRLILPHAFEISTFLFFVAPMCLITVLYVLIGLQLHKSSVPSRGGSVRLRHSRSTKNSFRASFKRKAETAKEVDEENCQLTIQEEDGRKNFGRNSQATRHVVKMLVAVVVAFFICWAPFHAQRLLAVYGQNTSTNVVTAFRILTYISGILYYLSTTVNPLLYHIMSNKFREAFKDTFTRCIAPKQKSTIDKFYSTLSAKSSQFNSNTDSFSRQSSLRYLDVEMARLHDSRRPVIVSFKRKKPQTQKSHKQATVFDAELREALDNLLEEPKRTDHYRTLNGNSVIRGEKEYSFVEVHSLQPRHICPLGDPRYFNQKSENQSNHKKHKERPNSLKNSCGNIGEMTDNKIGGKMTKSCTVPCLTSTKNMSHNSSLNI